ncbi:(-)-germacrene D synthase-like [Tasmannia lanceolata]|uniref:(-)-germacrene D synthase-like n=1 Tax=Tasmannia lanceolata TaxID=3420 RepID=UPI004064A439
MALSTSSVLSSSTLPVETGKNPAVRRSAGFHPSIWGDHFLSYTEDPKKLDAWSKRAEVSKEEVRRILINAKGSLEELDLLDAIQRVGVKYHFEKEIEEALHHLYVAETHASTDDLHYVSLRFRLLRQQGYNVSADVFRKFKDERGNFKASLSTDARGLLSLYEAAFLSIRGDDILDEAITFTKEQLKSAMTHDVAPLAKQIAHALEVPTHKRIQRLENIRYLTIYQEEKGRNDVLLELAKLDFNILQELHKKELRDLTKWWKDTDVAGKLPFIRDRLVECYYWILGVYYEPEYSRARIFSTKMTIMVSVVDDIYDVYATEDELQLFTDAIYRWDLEGLDLLPQFLKDCFLVLYDTVKELEDELEPEGKSYRGYYVKDAMKVLARDYFVEHKWYNRNTVPSVEEYLRVSCISVAVHMANVHCCAGMGDVMTKEAFEWLKSEPKVVMDASLIGRLLDDMQSTEFEQKRGHVASAVQCYMNEYGVTYNEACEKLHEMAALAWKDVNQACLKPTVFPLPVFMPAINLARVAEVIYLRGDGYTHSGGETKVNITLMLVNPISV